MPDDIDDAAEEVVSAADDGDKDYDDAFAEFSSDDEISDDDDAGVDDPGEVKDDDTPKVGEEDEATPAADSAADDVSKNETEVENTTSDINKLQGELASLNHKIRSNDGRVAAYQRQIVELQEQLSAKAGDATDDDDLDTNDLDEFKTEYPEIAGPLEKQRAKDQKAIADLTATVAALTGDHRQTQLDTQETLLAGAHPDWEAVTEQTEFGDWIKQQPLYVQQAAVRNGKEITNSDEAIDLIGRFKASRPQEEPPESDPAPEPVTTPLPGKRQRQLESAASVDNKGPGAASGPPEDFESAFDYYAGKEE